MKIYSVQILNSNKKIYSDHIKLGGHDNKGNKISFTNYFMTLNDKPFFGISGEFHYSRYNENLWEDEIIKMKNCGINIISTYVFWIHHEEREGEFDWTRNKNLRHFVELCGKHKLYVIIRIGPFSHGEVRNGGLPDWLFGQTFEVRSNNEDYLKYVRRFYSEISKQITGLLFKDGGPIVGVQIENEYMHAGAPWELTTGVSNDWITAGHDGESHMKILKNIAIEEGIIAPIYTCTAWGGAAAPVDEMLPMWGGYAFWPWIFYGNVDKHPATPEYIFRDYHNNKNKKLYNFEPQYDPEDYPYACCEMGGGMTVFYKYRFIVPPESVKAMSIVKVASGANFIGYYMFHGGSNPRGYTNIYLNEHAVPKISYDFQAPLGEFGQVRKSYKTLKLLHYFLKNFEEDLCQMKTQIFPESSTILPENTKTLRCALRIKDRSGFLFINNYQDHVEMQRQDDFKINIKLNDEDILIPKFGALSLEKNNSCILPFNLDLKEVILKYATAQLITTLDYDNEKYYFFVTPSGMKSEYCLNNSNITDIKVENGKYNKIGSEIIVYIDENQNSLLTLTVANGHKINIVTLTEEESLNFWEVSFNNQRIVVVTNADLIVSEDKFKLEHKGTEDISLMMFPKIKIKSIIGGQIEQENDKGSFSNYKIKLNHNEFNYELKQINFDRYVLKFKDNFDQFKELIMKIEYFGDIGYAFSGNELINDNFYNGSVWEIGLKKFEKQLLNNGMRIYISPVKEDSAVKNDSPTAGRSESSKRKIGRINSIQIEPVYEIKIDFEI